MEIKELCKTPLFWVAIILMICSGASELSMAQWASAYVEAALKLPKSVGDLAGPCMFAVTMGISRVIYGKFGEKMKLGRFMILSGILCLICYAFASFSIIQAMGLAGCVICGFSVGIMWPGTLSISSKKFPRGGTAMFALLAMAGDLGGSIGPGIVGRVTQFAGDNIQTGLRVGMVFPLILLLMVIVMDKSKVK